MDLGNLLGLSQPQLPCLENESTESHFGRGLGKSAAIITMMAVSSREPLHCHYTDKNTMLVIFVYIFLDALCLYNMSYVC